MKSSAIKCAALLCIVNLTGCGFLFGKEGYFRDRGDDYLKADSIPPMRVPDGTNQELLGQLYVVPTVNKADYEYPTEFEVPRPEALSSNIYSENVKIQRLGEQSWIFINASPSEVWPRVRNFLNTTGLQVAHTNPPRGLIETTWLNFKDDTQYRDKYRLRIEQGIQPDSAEIHVTHFNMPRDAEMPAEINWPARSSDAERESWMINELAANLAAEIGSASASLLAQTIGGSQKIGISNRGGEPALRMELDPDRALASLNHALDQEWLRIVDQDSDAGIYYVHYSDPEEGDGFFSGWFSRNNNAQKYTVGEILDQMNLDDSAANRELFPPRAFTQQGERVKDISGYLFIVQEDNNSIQVVVRDPYGKPVEPREARELLGMVRRNLI
ncbi:MAG: outer membrane protein assembly factor BamC [Cellvibrionaceae bacterium]